MNSKQLYNEVYKVEGHNYGEFKDQTNTSIKFNSQLEIFKKYLNLHKISDKSVVVEIGCGLGHLNSAHPNWKGFEYSNVDFSASLIRRRINEQSITAPDNDHLHNRVYAYFKSVFKSKNIANSATGLSIVAGSSGVALAGYVGELIPISSNLWFFVFFAQCGLYGLIFVSAGKRKNKPQ